MVNPTFPTDQQSIYQRLFDFNPRRYDQTRNYLDGQVSFLSPYITHGFLTLPMIRKALVSQYGKGEGHRFIFQLCLREFCQRIFWRYGEKALWSPMEARKSNVEYEKFFPESFLTGKMGIKALDRQILNLKNDGYLHVQARRWLASYLTNYTATDWHLGAKLFFYYSLDGDIAVNNLSWQEVMGTFSDQPYLFNQDMINTYVSDYWRESGGALDAPVEDLKERFLNQHRFLLSADLRVPFDLHTNFEAIAADLVTEEQILNEMQNCNEVIYIHEWMINEYNVTEFDPEEKCYRLLVIDRDFWTKNPVSDARLKFMVGLAQNIPNVRIYLGNPVELFKKVAKQRPPERGVLKIYSQEYFGDRMKSVFTSLYCGLGIDLEVWSYPWMFPTLTAVPNRFNKFFSLVERVW